MPGTVLLLAASPVGKGCLVDAASVLPVLAAVSPQVLSGADTANVVELADPLEPQAVLTRLRAAAGAPGPLTVFLTGQLSLDRRQHLPHLALARTTPASVRYTAFPWHWIAEELRLRAPGTTAVVADLHADPAAWQHLLAHPLSAGPTADLYGRVAPPPPRRTVASPTYMKAVATLLRSGHRPPLPQLHEHALARVTGEGGHGDLILHRTAQTPGAGPEAPARPTAPPTPGRFVPSAADLPVPEGFVLSAPAAPVPGAFAPSAADQPIPDGFVLSAPAAPGLEGFAPSAADLPVPEGVAPAVPAPEHFAPPAAALRVPDGFTPSAPAPPIPGDLVPAAPALPLPQGSVPSAADPPVPDGSVPAAADLPLPEGFVPSAGAPPAPEGFVLSAPAPPVPEGVAPAALAPPVPGDLVPSAPGLSVPRGFAPSAPAAQVPEGSVPSAAAPPAPEGFVPSALAPPVPGDLVPSAPGLSVPRGFAPSAPAAQVPEGSVPSAAAPPAPEGFVPSALAPPVPGDLVPSAPGPSIPRGFAPSASAPPVPGGFVPSAADPPAPAGSVPSPPLPGGFAPGPPRPAERPRPQLPPEGVRADGAESGDPHALIAEAVRAGRHVDADGLAAREERDAVRAHGPGSEQVLHWMEVRADLAMFAGDAVRSCRTWLAIATARLGAGQLPEEPAVETAADHAHHQWGTIDDPARARELGPAVADLRRRVPGRREGALSHVQRHLDDLQATELTG
ncbi:hypothetical protein ACIP79_06335 [Streptomyces sp. NPDC088747]|uniref:hypothetical protein n=1 Tax=Streptomyces sp. NPDC088747 TaxID=3365886 RepID=UPI0038109321